MFNKTKPNGYRIWLIIISYWTSVMALGSLELWIHFLLVWTAGWVKICHFALDCLHILLCSKCSALKLSDRSTASRYLKEQDKWTVLKKGVGTIQACTWVSLVPQWDRWSRRHPPPTVGQTSWFKALFSLLRSLIKLCKVIRLDRVFDS